MPRTRIPRPPQATPPSAAVLARPGRPLDGSARARLEPRFGHSFAGVRVHDGPAAAAAARALDATAFASGRDLVFDDGAYAPGTVRGDLLLAHELAHVVQHDRGPTGAPTARAVAAHDSAAESEADGAVAAVALGGDAAVTAAPGGMIACAEPDWLDRALEWAGGDHVVGDRPAGDGAFGPGAWWGGNASGGIDAGFNLNGQVKTPDWSLGSLGASGSLGAWTENDGHDERYGLKGQAGVGRGAWTPLPWLSGDVGAFTASVDSNAGTDGFSLGAQANILEGSVSLGSGVRPTQENLQDEMARVGLSAGVGAAARGYWGDQDGDGFREYGFGGDLEFLSMDLKTEDPLRTGLGMGLGPLGSLLVDPFLPAEGNMTEGVANMVGLTTRYADLDSTLDVVSDLLPDVGALAGGALTGGASLLGGAAGGLGGQVSQLWDELW